jgi:hypothetical protein
MEVTKMLRLLRFALLVLVGITVVREAEGMPWICVSNDKHGFVMTESGHPFVPWGFNYDHDENGRLLEDYWDKEWPKVEQDFRGMKELGANVVRVHLQLGKFMTGPEETNSGVTSWWPPFANTISVTWSPWDWFLGAWTAPV